MKIKEKVGDFKESFSEGIFLVLLSGVIAFAWLFDLLWRPFQKKEKKIKLQKDESTHCHSCGSHLYLELDRKKGFIDDWDSSCRYCLNEECKNYGKTVITVYNPDTFVPYTPGVKDEDEPILFRNDLRVKIMG